MTPQPQVKRTGRMRAQPRLCVWHEDLTAKEGNLIPFCTARLPTCVTATRMLLKQAQYYLDEFHKLQTFRDYNSYAYCSIASMQQAIPNPALKVGSKSVNCQNEGILEPPALRLEKHMQG